MEIFDIHVHALNVSPAPHELIARLEQSNIRGACVFSSPPRLSGDRSGTIFEKGISLDERICEVTEWTRSYASRLFPVLWIHPDEEGIFEGIEQAVAAGICGFKIICNDFYVYEDKCLRLLEKIASLEALTVTDEDLAAEYKRIAEAYNLPEEQVRAMVAEEDIKADMLVAAALKFVKDNAVVKKASKAKTEEAEA